MRLDQALVERGLAPSRSVAARLIASGAVHVEGFAVVRAATEVGPESLLRLEHSPENRFVSRAGAKLDGLLATRRDLVVAGYWVDFGQGTGGFSDCLLRRGAERVLGIEVGHGQLHPSLRKDPRVRCVEGVNVRDLQRSINTAQLDPAWPCSGASGVVIDLSFIGLEHALEPAKRVLAEGAWLVALIKPQFELGCDSSERSKALRRGVVRDSSVYPRIFARIAQSLERLGLPFDADKDLHESCLPGQEGNREFFIVARKPGPERSASANPPEF